MNRIYSSLLQVSMLGKYKLTVSDSVLKQLEEAPLAWKQLKRKMYMR